VDWQITPYVVGLSIATLLSLRAAVLASRYRDRPGGTSLTLSMVAIAVWAGTYVVEANAVTLELRIFWSTVAYFGSLSCAPLLLHFIVQFTQQGHRLRSLAARLALWLIPAISLLLVLTNGQHGLIWNSFTFMDTDHRIMVYGRGPAWWVIVAHQYVLLTTATIILVREAARRRHLYRAQSLAMLLSFVPPWLISMLYVIRRTILGSADWTPVAFALSGLTLSYAFRRLHLLDLVPVARDHVVESIQDGVVVLDPQGRVVDVNPAARAWIGGVDVIGQRAEEVFAQLMGLLRGPEIATTAQHPFWETASRGDFTVPELGTFEWQITPLKRGPAGPQGYLVMLHDVTEQRRAAEALQSLNEQLEIEVKARTAQILAEKELSDAILRNVSDGVLAIDGENRIRYANPAFSEMTGYSRDDVLGRPASEVLGDVVGPALAVVRETGDPWRGETEARRKDGRSIDTDLSISPMKDPEHDATVYVCTLHDTTQLRDLDRARKRFLDNISHQLRTPVTTLRLYAHLLGRTQLTEPQSRSLHVIDEQASWLQHLVEDILEMASLDSGKALTQWERVEMRTIVDHLTARYADQAEKAGLQLHIPSRGDDLPSIHGDRNRLIQAVSEIMDNAIRFTPPGGTVTLTTDRETHEQREWLTITVHDTGPGIPPDEQPRIFERFFRGGIDDSGQLRGTGLGAAIAQAIVQAHGGRITFGSTTGSTHFTIWLPFVDHRSELSQGG